MHVHHLNCGTLCPVGGHLMDGDTRGLGSARLVCHCLLIELPRELVLVDTGLGIDDVLHAGDRLAPAMRTSLQPRLLLGETAARQIEARGFDVRDVRHIVLTHLDCDHAGGISDFPEAAVHVLGSELGAAREREGMVARGRYRPAQWSGEVDWRVYRSRGEHWFGFDAVRTLEGLPPEILLVPLAGNTWGHSAVAVRTTQGWLLHAGDAYFFRGEVHRDGKGHYHCPVGLRAWQNVLEVDHQLRHENLVRLRELARSYESEVTVFSAHDHAELDALQSAGPRKLAGSVGPFGWPEHVLS